MNTQPVKTIKDDEKTPGRMKALISAKTGTAQGDELDMLAALFDVYEQQHTPIEAADPVGASFFGWLNKDLNARTWNHSSVLVTAFPKYSAENGGLPGMIRRLRQGLGISLEILVGVHP